MTYALVLLALAVVSGTAMSVMRSRGTLALPIPVLTIHIGMALAALLIFALKAR
jgi:hypothetical protein